MTAFPRPGHRPGRKGHRILKGLAEGARLTFAEIMDAAGVPPLTSEARKFPRLVSAMTRDGLIVVGRPGSTYRITDQGQTVLARLEAGETVETNPAPSVRVFRPSATA